MSEFDRGTAQFRKDTERLVIRDRFTDEEKKILLEDSAEIYLPTGLTILAQIDAQRVKGKPSFWRLIDGGNKLVNAHSRKIEVAIYPDPNKFFVPDSFSKNLKTQEEKIAKDAQTLRDRLKLQGVTEIIPDRASTLTEVVFQHLDKTGVWLLGGDYAAVHGLDFVNARTKNSTRFITDVAHVGIAHPDGGLYVSDMRVNRGFYTVGVARMVVPIKTK
jgi:hypothetical protein